MSERVIFSDYGCEVLVRGDRFFVRYDSGESAGSKLMESEITKDEAEEVQLSEQHAYVVILRSQARASANSK